MTGANVAEQARALVARTCAAQGLDVVAALLAGAVPPHDESGPERAAHANNRLTSSSPDAHREGASSDKVT